MDRLTQCADYEPFWRKHRDDWRAVTPADVWGLREDRTFHAPSRAHLKRLTRFRREVTPAETRVPDTSARAEHNARVKRAAGIAALCDAANRIR